MRLAVTGGIGCGKSLCGEFLHALGCPVCDTDVIARKLLEREQGFFEIVTQRFGRAILDRDGNIDRRLLGRLVFGDKKELQKLNDLLHPEIRRRWKSWLLAQHRRRANAAAVLIPLFYEIGEQTTDWELVICVAAPENLRKQRLRDRGLTASEIDERFRAQWPLEEKLLRADIVLYNNGSPDWLRRQTAHFYRRLIKLENQDNGRKTLSRH